MTPTGQNTPWKVMEIGKTNGYGIFEGECEIFRQYGHKMGLQRLVDRHNLSLNTEIETEAERFARRLDNEP